MHGARVKTGSSVNPASYAISNSRFSLGKCGQGAKMINSSPGGAEGKNTWIYASNSPLRPHGTAPYIFKRPSISESAHRYLTPYSTDGTKLSSYWANGCTG